jgi:hypothetical protein
MSWASDFISISKWAMQSLDLKYQYTFSLNVSELNSTPGISNALETSIVLSIYEAAVGKGFIVGETIDYVRKYPESNKRTDLAFKDSSSSRKWSFVEVKKYKTVGGKSDISKDIEKLKNIASNVNRWMFIYRFKQSNDLKYLLNKNFSSELSIEGYESFISTDKKGNETELELCLCRLG